MDSSLTPLEMSVLFQGHQGMERLVCLPVAPREWGGQSGLLWTSDSSSPTVGAEVTQAQGSVHWNPPAVAHRLHPPWDGGGGGGRDTEAGGGQLTVAPGLLTALLSLP